MAPVRGLLTVCVLLALATGVTFIGVIFHAWFLVGGALLCGAVLALWFWPRQGKPHEPIESPEKDAADDELDHRMART